MDTVTSFTPLSALIGGILIGLASVLLMATHGRIAGISGIAGGLLAPRTEDRGWRLSFLIGLILAPFIYWLSQGHMPEMTVPVSTPLLVLGGVAVGLGTQLGSGCTSGHGVCGMSRLSPRSLAATLTFMATGMITVFLIRHVWS